VDELVLRDGIVVEDALALIESSVAGSWLSIRNTSVKDNFATLSRRGYSFSSHTYYSLMAASLGGDGLKTSRTLGSTDRSFTCQQLDYF
jgi:hypothetical protein